MTEPEVRTQKKPALVSDIRKFLTVEALDGPLLIGAMVLAVILVNSPLDWLYTLLLSVRLEVRLEDLEVAKPLLLWINDGLMALFFLLIAVEIKHEAKEGHLSNLRQVVLPGAAAIGGIAVPALIYWWINSGDPVTARGWAIPAATDIAFSLGALGILGARVPRSLKAFLMTLAVFDDIGAILIIAVFYAGKISLVAHLLAFLATVALFAMNRFRVSALGPYFVVGAILWVCVLKSGVHATLAGVVLGFAIPSRHRDPSMPSPMKTLEHMLHPWVALVVLPLFAFANTGISFSGMDLSTILHPVTIGIVLGLVVGKFLGVSLVSLVMIKTGLARMPEGANWGSMLGISLLAGIGFTMSMFVGTLAFEGNNAFYATNMRLGVVLGSLIAAVIGLLVLHRATAPAARTE